MPTATINLTLDNDFLEKIDNMARNESRTRTEIIYNSIKMYIDQKQKLQELYMYGEKIALKNDITEEDIFNEIKSFRSTE